MEQVKIGNSFRMKLTEKEMSVLKRSMYVSDLESKKFKDDSSRLKNALLEKCDPDFRVCIYILLACGLVMIGNYFGLEELGEWLR